MAIKVAHSIEANQVVAALGRLAVARGCAPVFFRYDNGAELVAHAVSHSCRFAGTSSKSTIPAHNGGTAGSSLSTAMSVESSSRAGSSKASSKLE